MTSGLRYFSLCYEKVLRNIKRFWKADIFPRVDKQIQKFHFAHRSTFDEHNDLLPNIRVFIVSMYEGNKLPMLQVDLPLWNFLSKMAKNNFFVVWWDWFVRKYWIVTNPTLSHDLLRVVFFAILVKWSKDAEINLTSFDVFKNSRASQL